MTDERILEPLDLDVPDGVEYRMSWVMARDEQGAARAIAHNFQMRFQGETEPFMVVAEPEASRNQIEDLMSNGAAKMFARIVEKIKRKGNRLSLTELKDHDDYRHDFAALLRDYKATAKRRATFTSGQIYQPGITLPSKDETGKVEETRSS